MSQPHWPKRLREDVRLASLLDACAQAADPSDELIRDAARVALRSEPAGTGLRAFLKAHWEAWARQLRSRRALAAAALLAVLQLGLALAAEKGWGLHDFVLWTRPQAISPAPTIQPPLPTLSQSSTALPLSAVGNEPLPEAPESIAGAPTQRTERRRRTAARAPAPAPDRPDSLVVEAGMVSHAIALLDSAPRSSLLALDDYRRAFPAGALRGEAALAELRAHLALGDSRAALVSLDRLAADRFASAGSSAAELRTSRLELMAGAARCGEALGVLDDALTGAPSPRLQGRLLFVRASCRAAAGDAIGSKRDLRQYLHVLPEGPRAAEIRRRLSDAE